MDKAASKPFVYYRSGDLSRGTFERLAEFRSNRLLCDILLFVEDREIPAHRVLLAAVSSYFRAMFLGKLAESNQDQVTLYEVDGVAVELLVQYAYNGFVEINEFNVQCLLYASALLQFYEVNKACCDFLCKALNVANCLGIRSLAESLSCFELFEAAHQFAVDNFGAVLKQEEFYLQPYESLKSLLDCKFLNSSSEEEILNGVLEWIHFLPSERQRYVPALIKRSCLIKVAPDYLSNVILKDPVVQTSFECRRMILEVLDAMQSSNMRDLHEFNEAPLRLHRSGREILLALGGESEGVTLSSCQSLSLDSSNWKWNIPGRVEGSKSYIAHMNNGRTFMAVASTGQHAYVVGGHSSCKVLKSVERYEWPGNKWCQLSPLNVERMGAGAISLGNQPIVIGGNSKVTGCLSSAEMYDPLMDDWTLITPMNVKRSHFGAVEIADSVYAIGGFGREFGTSDDWLASVECLDAQRGLWFPVSPLSQPRAYLGAVEKDGKICYSD